MLRFGNTQVAALEQQLTSQFSAHPGAVIVRSQPGHGVVLGRGCWASSATARNGMPPPRAARRSPAPAPVTRSSGLRTTVVARAACNQRLVDAC
jgi:hypothetical protein